MNGDQAGRAILDARSENAPPAKPKPIMAQVDGSGAAVKLKFAPFSWI